MLTTDDLKKFQKVVQNVVDKRVEETETKMEHRFNAVDKRFEGIEIQLANMARQME